MKTTDTLLVGFDISNGKDGCVLIVGRKDRGEEVKIVNAFQGEEAEWMYNRLVTIKDNGGS